MHYVVIEMKQKEEGKLVYPAFKKALPGLLVPFDYEVDAGHDPLQ